MVNQNPNGISMITNKGNFKTKQITMTQQTAVEFLINHVLENFQPTDYTVMVVFEQAKQIEKEQIIDAYTIGSYDMAEKEFRPEKYYNETYQ